MIDCLYVFGQQILSIHAMTYMGSYFITVSTVVTATAGSTAKGKVRDSEEPGSLLFHLC